MTRLQPTAQLEISGARYQLRAPIAETALSEVWEAEDLTADRASKTPGTVAIKLFNPPRDLRLAPEAHFYRTLAWPLRPLFIPCYNQGRCGNHYALVLARMDSDLRGIDFETEKTLRLSRLWLNVAASLLAVHRSGFLHLDIKPGNILCNYDLRRFYLSDFGSVQTISGPSLSRESGSRGWMAPEQYLNQQGAQYPVSRATDIYAFGLMMFAMVTNRFPEGLQLCKADIDALKRGLAALELSNAHQLRLRYTISSCLRLKPDDRPTRAVQLLPVLRALNTATAALERHRPRRATALNG